MNLDGHIVTFGESLIRLSPPNHLRLRQSQVLDLVYGGAEANVAASLANFGLPDQYVTRLPENELGNACLQSLRQHGVGIEFVEFGGDRIGLYFLEVGSGHRPSRVIYDRDQSSFATLNEHTIPWPEVFAEASWFHWSGISPAVSKNAAKVITEAVNFARQAGLRISCDLNYRDSLWNWGAPPATVMPNLVKECDVLVANTANRMLGLSRLPDGRTPDELVEVCTQLSIDYPNLNQIAMTCREKTGAGGQQFTAIIWQSGQFFTSQSYTLADIVDRIGAGDAFMAGLIFGLMNFGEDPQNVVDFAAACSVLKHSIKGDTNQISIQDVEFLMSSSNKGFDIIR